MTVKEFKWQWVCLIPHHAQMVERGSPKVPVEIDLEQVIMRESDQWFDSEVECRKAAEANCDFDFPCCWGLELCIQTRES